MKLNRKEFFQPNRRKILVTISFIIMTIFLNFTLDNCFALSVGGHPFFCTPLYIIGGKIAYFLYHVIFRIPPFKTLPETTQAFSFFLNITDYLFYYSNACFLVWIYERSSKKSRK